MGGFAVGAEGEKAGGVPDRCPPQRLELHGCIFATACRRPVSGLASGITRCRVDRLPALDAQWHLDRLCLLTVAGAAPESNRLPVSPHLPIVFVPPNWRAMSHRSAGGHLRRGESRCRCLRAQVRSANSGEPLD